MARPFWSQILHPALNPAPQNGSCTPSYSNLGSLEQVRSPYPRKRVELVHCHHLAGAVAGHLQEQSCPQGWPRRTCPAFRTRVVQVPFATDQLFRSSELCWSMVSLSVLCSRGVSLCRGQAHKSWCRGHPQTTLGPSPRIQAATSFEAHGARATGYLPTQWDFTLP